MKRILHFVFLIVMLFNVAGCAALIVGGAVGVAGAYAISRDTLQGMVDGNFQDVWETSIEVVREFGEVSTLQKDRGLIIVKSNATFIKVRIVRITKAVVKLRVSARKHHLPNLTLAQEIYTRILNEIK